MLHFLCFSIPLSNKPSAYWMHCTIYIYMYTLYNIHYMYTLHNTQYKIKWETVSKTPYMICSIESVNTQCSTIHNTEIALDD